MLIVLCQHLHHEPVGADICWHCGAWSAVKACLAWATVPTPSPCDDHLLALQGRSRQRKQAPKRCAEAEVPAGDGAALPELAAEQPDAAKAPAAAGEQISDAGAAPTGLATAAEDPALAEATAGVHCSVCPANSMHFALCVVIL